MKELIMKILGIIERLVELIMKLPILQPGNTSRVVTDVFLGYNHNLKIADGEMYDTKNLTSDFYPMLARRKPRVIREASANYSGLIGGDKLIYVKDNTLYVDGVSTGFTFPTSYNRRQLIRFGHYVVSFPDQYYYNLSDSTDNGDMASSISHDTQHSPDDRITYEPCDIDGNLYIANYEQSTEPGTANEGEIWYKTDTVEFYRYSAIMTMWVKIENVYTKINFPTHGEIPANFKAGDSVEIEGMAFDELNGVKYLYKVGGEDGGAYDYIIVVGVGGTWCQIDFVHYGIKREIPLMDYVIECQNRLWGCVYQYNQYTGETVNELYCSALGDFKNWRVYQGLSTDSWSASIGAPGKWTGAISYLGKPVFFKEDRVYVVTISAQGAHRVEETQCRGVEDGSSMSLRVVGETVYYKSLSDIMAWQGGFPVSVSNDVFGNERLCDGNAGAVGTKYYLCMRHKDNKNKHDLFVYDISKGFWLKEESWTETTVYPPTKNLHFLETVGEQIYFTDKDYALTDLTGTLTGLSYTKESSVPWEMETGIMYYQYPDRKYVSRYDIRLWMEAETSAKIYMEYDSDGQWIESGTIQIAGTGTVTVPIRPRRCDHLRMRLSGTGDFKILSIARILEVGSDV